MNVQIERLCSDSQIRSWPRIATKGAANVAWQLHKTNLLYLQAKEATNSTSSATTKQKKETIGFNTDRMMGAQKAVLDMNTLLQKLGSKKNQVAKRAIIQQKEEQFKDGLKELENSQESLRKSTEERLKQGKVSQEETDNLVEGTQQDHEKDGQNRVIELQLATKNFCSQTIKEQKLLQLVHPERPENFVGWSNLIASCDV